MSDLIERLRRELEQAQGLLREVRDRAGSLHRQDCAFIKSARDLSSELAECTCLQGGLSPDQLWEQIDAFLEKAKNESACNTDLPMP